ncbi:MAG TPA: nucleotidyltransferase domain-containing protein [Methanosarcinaceae archaeon]|nr:nucleotidyltransferase domain-containing protein [Methanosarcinaceae archaeon]
MIDNAKVGDKLVRRFLTEKIDIIVSKFNPEKLILFGSRAWGKPTDDSDIYLIRSPQNSKRVYKLHIFYPFRVKYT